MDSETYKSLPTGPMNDVILKKKLVKKERERNFMIACSIGKLKYMNALADQGSNMNIMPLAIYNKLTSEQPMRTNIRLSLDDHSFVYPIGIAEDVLVEIAGFMYPVDFVIFDIKEDEYTPLILGTPFLITTRANIRSSNASMTLRAGKYKVRFIRTLRFFRLVKEKDDLDPMILTYFVKGGILECEERIEKCKDDEIEFGKWRSKVFEDKNLVGHNFFIYDDELEKDDDSRMDDRVT
ncbi:zf-CCHC domain-containing protein [Tanacetum coccineum]